MQNIKPLLASASPLGVIQNFDISNRFLLRKSNFKLGLTNYIEPLGTRLLAKSPLVKPLAEYSNLLPSQEQPVIDEGWDFQAFTFPANELEGDIYLRQEEETEFSDNDFIENQTTTIITDFLPNTTQNNFYNRLENNQDSIISTNSATNITIVNKSHIPQSKPSKKTNSKSKDKSKTKSRTKKSSTDKSEKQPKKRLASNSASETHQILSNDNELLLNSPSLEDSLEANNLLSEIKNPENTDVAVKEIVNEQPIKNPNTNTIFHEIQESDNIVQADFLENTQSESHSIDLGTFVNQSVDNLSNYQENSTKIEQLNNQENLANTKFIPKAIAEPIFPKTPNLIAEGLNQQENLVNTQLIPETIVQRTANLIVEGLNQQGNLANTKFIPEATTEPIVLKTPNLIVEGLNQQENLVNTQFIPEIIVQRTPNLIVEGLNQQENLANTKFISEATTEPIVLKTPNLIVEGLNQQENLANTKFIPEATPEPIVPKTPNLIAEGLNQQENLVNTKFIPEATPEPIVPKTPNLTVEGLNQQENLVNTQLIPETIVQRTPNLIVEGLNQQENLVNTKFIPEATPEPIVPKTPNLTVEGLNQQENLVKTQLIAEAITEPIVQKTPNLTVEGLNQSENLANTEFTPEVITEQIVQKTPNLIVEDTGKNPKIYSDEQIISFADSTKLVSNNISETTINNTFGNPNINLEPTNAKIDLSPIIQTVIKDDITENQPPLIPENTQVNNLKIVNDIIYPVLKPDSIIAKPTQDDLQVNYPVQSANNYPQATTDLINNQQIEATKILSNQEISTDAEISDTAVNLRSQPDKNVDNAKLNLQVNNIYSNLTDQIDTSKLNDNTAIKTINLESNVNSINQEQILGEVLIPDVSGIVNKFPETQNIETITDSTEVSPKNFFDNLPQHFQELPAPTGYAIGGLVAPSNAVNAPIASSDTIPAMLTPGEFVINTRDAQKNINVLRHINSGGILPEDITTPSTPNIEPVEETNTDFLQPSTLVDNFQTSPDIISPKLTNSSISSQQNSEIISSVTTDNPLQFNVFTSTKNSTDLTENLSNYSSPPLIFREVNNNTTKNNNLNTNAPSQWNTVEELLNGSADESTIFNYSNDNTESINYNSNSNLNYTNLQTPQIATKRLPVIQGFADGREVTESDIATDIQPITETIQIPADSDNSNNEEKNKNDSPDLETLAREIYGRLRQRLEIERERYGMYSGRLPW